MRVAYLYIVLIFTDMEKKRKRLLWTEAYKLMNAKDNKGKNKPFDISFVCLDGSVDELSGVLCAFSFNRKTGMRRLKLSNGEFRNVYDVLILQINGTIILVK